MSENPDLSNRLAGRVALVTGGGSGIGRASAIRLAAQGARILVTDVRLAAAEQTATEVRAGGGIAHAEACDVGEESSVKQAVMAAVREFDKLDTLVCAAGVGLSGRTHELALEDWDRVLRTNLTGVFLAVKHTLPELVASGDGSIVTIGSISSLVAGGLSPTYDASKGGVLLLTRHVAVEYAHTGVRANCVCPGSVTTGFRTNSRTLLGAAPADLTPAPRPAAPINRWADPAEIASVVAFLCSPDSSFMTGAAIPVDGGATAGDAGLTLVEADAVVRARVP